MRRFTFVFSLIAVVLLGTTTTAQAQMGTRNAVVVEIATGTWCTFCPGSALGADDLVLNGHPVAIVEHHNGDTWETTETADRTDNYYGVTGYPTTYFDGANEIVGGNASQSIYGSYVPNVNAAIAAPTPFNISLNWTQTGATINATVDVEQVGAYTGPITLHLVATESHIPDSWLAGLTEVNFVNRKMSPDQNGTALTITQGQTVSTPLTFNIDPSWVQEKMELVAFIQNPTSKVIYNGINTPLRQPTGQYDPELANLINPISGLSCATSYAPEVAITNQGSDDITSMDISYSVNGGTASTYNWTGTLGFGATAVVMLPAINFTPIAAGNMVNIDITSINGGMATDADLTNNAASSSWDYSRQVGDYDFSLTTDDYGYETYWQIVDGGGNVVASGGNTNVGPNGGGAQTAAAGDPGAYGNNTTVNQTLQLYTNDCYSFVIVDDYGDGICCSYGQGSYSLTDPNGGSVFTGGQFAGDEDGSWYADGVVGVDSRLDDAISVFPNPSNGIFRVQLTDEFAGAELTINSIDGRTVFQTVANELETTINLNNLASGMYMMQVRSENSVAVKKLEIR